MKKGLCSILILGILCLAFAGYIIIPNFNYLILGKTIDLNKYIEDNGSSSVDLPENEIVTLSINKCYGEFSQRSRLKSSDEKYYLVELEDKSTIVVEVVVSKKTNIAILDKIAEDTKSSRDRTSYSTLTYTGKLMELHDNKVNKAYASYVEELKKDKILDDDVNVRQLVINSGGERFWGILLTVIFIFLGVFFVFVGIKSFFVEV